MTTTTLPAKQWLEVLAGACQDAKDGDVIIVQNEAQRKVALDAMPLIAQGVLVTVKLAEGDDGETTV